MDREELTGWLRLQLTPGIGNQSARNLLAALGLPDAIFASSLKALKQVVSESQARALHQVPEGLETLVETTLKWLRAEPRERRVLSLSDPAYPKALLDIEDPPLLLHAIGVPEIWRHNLLNHVNLSCLAVVGSRNPTPQGADNAAQFSQALASAGLTIVSGLAAGIDAAAHEGALEGAPAAGIATIAVVGTGLDRVYPKQHRTLAHRIAQRGVLLSEYVLGTAPLAANFPRRNRIISGLSRGTLVVEAALQSGSLITARLAAEQGRDVFAIPGSIHTTQSRGCHALIKQGAKLVESAQDILEELGVDLTLPHGVETVVDETDSSLLQALGFDPTSLDALQARTGLDTASLQAQLMELELAGQVGRLPGGLFQRIARA
jgi:DNA processing protein